MKGSIYFSNNQCKILYQDEYLFVCVVILHYRSNKCIQCPIWRQIQPIHCIHYIWRHWFWLANGYIRKPRVLSYVIKNSCRKVQQYSSWEKWIGLFIFIDLTKCAPQFETASQKHYNQGFQCLYHTVNDSFCKLNWKHKAGNRVWVFRSQSQCRLLHVNLNVKFFFAELF